jgi:hypothetical protein
MFPKGQKTKFITVKEGVRAVNIELQKVKNFCQFVHLGV